MAELTEQMMEKAAAAFMAADPTSMPASTAVRAFDALARLRLMVLGKDKHVDIEVEQRYTVVHDWVPMSPADDSNPPDFVSLPNSEKDVE